MIIRHAPSTQPWTTSFNPARANHRKREVASVQLTSCEVSLATGAAGAAVATAFVTDDSGGSGGVPDAPEIVRACDVIDIELVSAALGPAVLLRASGDVKTSRCIYEMASGRRLELSVQRRSNQRSDAFRPFRRSNEGVVEIRSLDWSGEGEMRASEHLEIAGELFARYGAKLYLDQVIAKKQILKA